jgi:hypothetical protein
VTRQGAWHAVAHLVFAFAVCVAWALVSGQLDPVGSPAYGVVVSWRIPVLLALLGAVQVTTTVDCGGAWTAHADRPLMARRQPK